jgi:anti-sigma regulatory factor (Ser/Thr protein kinase)
MTELASTTELLVSELVTNAVKTTAGHPDQAAVRLRLSGDSSRVLIEVWDADPRPPALKTSAKTVRPTRRKRAGAGCSWWRRSANAGVGYPRRSLLARSSGAR